jgi:hypothetical protein
MKNVTEIERSGRWAESLATGSVCRALRTSTRHWLPSKNRRKLLQTKDGGASYPSMNPGPFERLCSVESGLI